MGLLFACSNNENVVQQKDLDSLSVNGLTKKIYTTSIQCDSIFPEKGYIITLNIEDTENLFPSGNECNAEFLMCKTLNDKNEIIYQDSVVSAVGIIEFEDYNGDGIKDVLIQNETSARSNWTHNLYMVSFVNKDLSLKKIKNFNGIPNPRYLPEYDIIDNLVMSGRNWTNFYKIQGDSIYDYNMVIYQGADENDKDTYDEDYKEAIKKITASKN